jgi:lysosomal alpha-mannosidase
VLRFPVKEANVEIFNSDGEALNVQFIPVPEQVKSIPGRDSEAQFDAVFLVSDLPALGYRTFYVQQTNQEIFVDQISRVKSVPSQAFPSLASINFYSSSGNLNHSSGAYIFRPEIQEKTPFEVTSTSQVVGDLVEEIWYEFENSWTSMIQRKYLDDEHYEVPSASVHSVYLQ